MMRRLTEKPKFRFRDACENDHATLSALAIRSKAYWGYSREFMEACRAELELPTICQSEELTRLAEAPDGIAGFYRLALDDKPPEIEAFFVDPAWIGQGVGRLLFQDMQDALRNAGIGRILCQSDPHAEPFYLRMGMRRIGQSPSASIAGRNLPLLDFAPSDAV